MSHILVIIILGSPKQLLISEILLTLLTNYKTTVAIVFMLILSFMTMMTNAIIR